MLKKKLLFSFLSILINAMLFSQNQGATYCGPYVSSPPIVLNGISDSTISGLEISNPTGNCIEISNCQNIIIKHCKLGPSTGNGINIYNSDSVFVTDCRIDSVATGVYAQSSTRIQVISIDVKNVIGPFPRGQLTQFNQVTGAGNKINYNVSENILGESYPEDIINLYQSKGAVNDPIQVIGNWIRGGGPSSSGGGIMTGDAGGGNIIVKDNILVDPGQYGVAIASGDSIQLINNTVYAKPQSFTNVGLYVWNQYESECSSHTVSGNKTNWTNKDGQLNHSWNSGNCGTVSGWNNNLWGADIDSTILPDQILLNCSVVNLAENEISNPITIFPNPNKGIVNIDLATLKDVSINVSNVNGQIVFRENNINTNRYTFELNNDKGIYFIEVTSKDISHNYKLIIK